MKRLFMASLLALTLVPQAEASDPQTAIALRVIDNYVVPHYRAFEKETLAQRDAWASYCKDPAHGDKQSLIAAFNATQDSWEAIEHVRTGPVTLFLRAERIDYWPEVRNATAKGLAALLAGSDPHELDPETLAAGSVAAQGLPALERLIYDGADLTAPRPCAIGAAITLNLSTIAHDIVTDWTATNSPRAGLADGKKVPAGFTDGAEASRGLLTDLMTSFQRMLDFKLLAVVGSDAANAKPKAAENWRSLRSARNLKIDLDSTNEMIGVFAKDLKPSDMADLDKTLQAAKASFEALPDDIGAAASDEKGRAVLDKAIAALKTARDQTRAILPAKLNITLGFNALDGD